MIVVCVSAGGANSPPPAHKQSLSVSVMLIGLPDNGSLSLLVTKHYMLVN